MPASFEHERSKPLLLLPGGYFYLSRLRKFRDLAVNTIQWIVPALIVSVLLAETDYVGAAGLFAWGLLLFVCIYEIGYLANDSYGLRHDPTPRARVKIRFDTLFVVPFLIIRIGVFAAIVWHLELWQSPVFLICYLALIAVLVMHNTLIKVQFKFFTFFQLSLFRFALPGLPIFIVENLPFSLLTALLTGFVLFTFPRLLTYFDAKGRMDIEERKETRFLLLGYVVSLPVILVLSAGAGTIAPICGWVWAIFSQLVFVQASKHRNFR